jgi:uncharacterized protein (DUF58 family)
MRTSRSCSTASQRRADTVPLLPSRRLAALLALAAVAFLVDPLFALLLDAGLIGAAVADAVTLYRRPLPVIDRSIPERIPLDGIVDVRVEVRNRATRPLRMQWTDDLPQSIERIGAETFDEDLPPTALTVRTYAVRGSERGNTALGDIHVRLLGPLGLVWRQVRLPRRNDVVVQPGLLDLRRHRVLALHDRSVPGVRTVRERAEGREFERLREYVRGDDTRRIDWKATARRGALIVREYEAERSQNVVLAIDAGRLMTERIAGRERLDHALSAALVLADAAASRSDAVGALLFADYVQAFLPPARNPLARVAATLSQVDARMVEPDYPAAFHYLGRKLRRRSLIVLFTDVVDAAVSATLLAHVATAARRHLPLLVALRNTELEDAATAPVNSEADAFRRAAAEELLRERAIALAAIRRQGVLVADVRPANAVPETLARYLEVKRRGLL